jgi:CRP-like cAMP-binding protein
LARAGARRSLRRKQRLFARGDAGDALVLVLTGRIDVVRGTSVLRSLGADALLGLSTVAGAPHTADLVAAEASEVLIVPGGYVRALFAKRPELPRKIIVALAQLVSDLSDDVEAFRNVDLVERTRRKIIQLGRGRREVTITHAELARQVGATRANTSRALGALERQGVLRRRRGRIEIRSP